VSFYSFGSLYSTRDEIEFLRELRERNPLAYIKYRALVPYRDYDSGVDRERVLAWIRGE
jgi:hypothetical protein